MVELLMSIAILAMVMGGIIYGYQQANQFAEASSMSLAAQSYALQGLEVARGAKWDLSANPKIDDMPVSSTTGMTNFILHDNLDVPVSGAPIPITNYVTITTVTNALSSASLRMVRSDCIWYFAHTRKTFTNTVIGYRAADRQ